MFVNYTNISNVIRGIETEPAMRTHDRAQKGPMFEPTKVRPQGERREEDCQ